MIRATWGARTLWRPLRRTLLTILGLQVALALVMTLVDSYRRRGRHPKPFPITPRRHADLDGDEVTTYTYGADLYDDMISAIEGARTQILFETYIWKGDATGERFKRALADAAARGVAVHVIYDAFANLVVSPAFKRFPSSMRVLRYPVYNAGWRFFDGRRYGRDHRKLLVVDDRIGFVGGYNIGDAYATEWRDTHCRIVGPGVFDLKRAFADFWNLNRRHLLSRDDPPLLMEAATRWESAMRVHRNVPRMWMFPIRSMYLEAIGRAQQRVWLTTAYFLPDQDFVDELKLAAARGVDVRIIVPGKSNHIVADWISRGYYSQLLSSGIRVFRFRDAMVHAKTATVDGSWTTIGTANIDRLSLTGNYEINVEFIDQSLAAVMEEIFETDLSNCFELTEAEWESRDVYRRFTEAFLNPLRPLL